MTRRWLRLGLVVWFVLIIAGSWYVLTNQPFRAGSTDMPQTADLIAGQQQDGTFYAAQQRTDGATEVSLSPRGQVWSNLPSALPGRLQSIADSPLDDALIYAATDAGFYVSGDGGSDWNAVDLPGSVTAVAMDTQMADLAYVATDEPAIYRLTDLGTSQQRVTATGLDGDTIQQLVVHGENSQIVLAVTDRGVFRSESAGETWNRVDGLPGDVTSIAAAPDNVNVVYAGTRDAGFFRSRDGGQSWNAANVGLDMVPGASLAITAITVDPAQQGMLYAATGYVLGHTQRVLSPAGIYLSVDGGTDWVRIAGLEPGAEEVTALVPAPNGSVRAITASGVQTYELDAAAAARALDSADVNERLAAAKLLSVSATADQADALLAHLDDVDPQVGYYTARALGRVDTEQVRAALISRVETGTPAETQRAIIALGALQATEAVPALRNAFLTQEGMQTLSAQALAKIGTEDAWNILTDALNSETYTAQRQAAMTAFEQRGEPAVPTLIAALDSDNAALRANAAQVLGFIDSPQAIHALRPLLSDQVPAVRAAAAQALGKLGDTTSLTMLNALAETDEDAAVRAAAEEAITNIQADPTLLPDEALTPPAVQNLGLRVTPVQAISALLIVMVVGTGTWWISHRRGPRLAS